MTQAGFDNTTVDRNYGVTNSAIESAPLVASCAAVGVNRFACQSYAIVQNVGWRFQRLLSSVGLRDSLQKVRFWVSSTVHTM